MKKIIQLRWLILILWIGATGIFLLNQPDIGGIVNEKGESTLPDDASSVLASQMLEEMNQTAGDTMILVFYNQDQLSDSQMTEIEDAIDTLNKSKEELCITQIVDPFGTPAAKDQLISKDGTTLMVQIGYQSVSLNNKELLEAFYDKLDSVSVEHYLTGGAAIATDYVNTVSDGVEKSGIITVIFILLVLILMFRSVVTPLVSLIAVGVSYLVSMGVIGIMINVFDFPVTSFTQMFVILVLFGIGTDYHILLLNRFKEELSNGNSVDDSIVISLKTAGKTILFSGLTVFIGFLSLTFVKFPVYRAANAVAIGIAILLVEILTLTPVFMKVMGARLFWPSRFASGHKESRFWGNVTGAAVKHPIWSLVVVALVIVPVLLFNTTKLSFDSMADLDPGKSSVKGFNIIADAFGKGTAMPVTLVIHHDEAMDNNEDLATLDALIESLKTIDGVAAVAGPTQPMGEKITDLYTNRQLGTVTDGIEAANDGIKQVSDGLDTISQELTIPDLSKLDQLTTGTGALADGVTAIQQGLEAVDAGMSQGAEGAMDIATGVASLKAGVASIHEGLAQISANLATIQDGYTQLGTAYTQIGSSIEQLIQLQQAMELSIANLVSKYPSDVDVLTLQTLVAQMGQGLNGLSQGMTLANGNYTQLTDGLALLEEALKQTVDATATDSDLVKGIDQLEAGATALAEGLTQGSAGQQQMIDHMDDLAAGANQVRDGVTTLTTALQDLGTGMSQLKDGIDQGKDGLDTISEGLTEGNAFLNQLESVQSFYIPEEAMKSHDITTMLDAYMSGDRTYSKITITLDTEPYSDESIHMIDPIDKVIESELQGTSLEDATYGLSGATATSKDMSDTATHDITFTQIMVLASIFILLVLIIRSFWIPVFIVGSLMVAYYTALSATAFFANLIFHNPNGMAWNVPFFSFVMIAALGVDYSIFLMERYREYPHKKPHEAIVKAAKNIGGVVLSAAIILSGTFATLMPTNLVVLIELAICVIIGLMLLSLVLLPIVIPALITIQDRFTGFNNRD